jgi:hypothetical protein
VFHVQAAARERADRRATRRFLQALCWGCALYVAVSVTVTMVVSDWDGLREAGREMARERWREVLRWIKAQEAKLPRERPSPSLAATPPDGYSVSGELALMDAAGVQVSGCGCGCGCVYEPEQPKLTRIRIALGRVCARKGFISSFSAARESGGTV